MFTTFEESYIKIKCAHSKNKQMDTLLREKYNKPWDFDVENYKKVGVFLFQII